MVLLSLLLAAVTVPLAAVICFGVSAALRRLGFIPNAEKVSNADLRWLAAQRQRRPSS